MQSSLDAAQFFDRFAPEFDTLYDGRRGPVLRWLDRKFRSDMFIRFALTFEAFGDLEGRSVLDVGCGSGPYVVEALKRGASSVTGVDPAVGMLALAKSKLAGTPWREKGDFVSGMFPGPELEQHDFAIVMGVMDYVEDPKVFLTALKPLVRRLAAISFPSRHWLRTPIRKLRYRVRHCPVYFYDAPQIERLARAAGFRRTTIRKIPGAGLDYHTCLEP